MWTKRSIFTIYTTNWNTKILPRYYADDDHHASWIEVMKGAIGKNACYFNTHRMMRQYVTQAYLR